MTTHPQDATTDEPGASELSSRAASRDAGRWERIATATVGGALLRSGLKRRSLGGAVTALAGGWLVYRGIRGRSLAGMVGSRPAAGHETSEHESESMATGPTAVQRSITVEKPADELTQFWQEPDQLSRIFGPTVEVTAAGDGDGDSDEQTEESAAGDGDGDGDSDDQTETRYRWTAEGPLDRQLTWETRTIEERPGELLRWETLEGATIPHTGTVRFQPAPGDRGTEVTLGIHVEPPGGTVGETIMNRANLVPKTLVGTALRRFKSLAETGEIPSLEKNPSARGKGDML